MARHNYTYVVGAADRAKLYVPTLGAKVALYFEMQGQFSDGRWENSTPEYHWEPWCDLKWNDIIVDKERIGRTFDGWNIKDGYAMTATDLLDVIGDRMRYHMKLFIVNPDLEKNLDVFASEHSKGWLPFSHLPDSGGDFLSTLRLSEDMDAESHWEACIEDWNSAGIDIRTAMAADGWIPERYNPDTGEHEDREYTLRHLKKDLRLLSQAMKTVLRLEPEPEPDPEPADEGISIVQTFM